MHLMSLPSPPTSQERECNIGISPHQKTHISRRPHLPGHGNLSNEVAIPPDLLLGLSDPEVRKRTDGVCQGRAGTNSPPEVNHLASLPFTDAYSGKTAMPAYNPYQNQMMTGPAVTMSCSIPPTTITTYHHGTLATPMDNACQQQAMMSCPRPEMHFEPRSFTAAYNEVQGMLDARDCQQQAPSNFAQTAMHPVPLSFQHSISHANNQAEPVVQHSAWPPITLFPVPEWANNQTWLTMNHTPWLPLRDSPISDSANDATNFTHNYRSPSPDKPYSQAEPATNWSASSGNSDTLPDMPFDEALAYMNEHGYRKFLEQDCLGQPPSHSPPEIQPLLCI